LSRANGFQKPDQRAFEVEDGHVPVFSVVIVKMLNQPCKNLVSCVFHHIFLQMFWHLTEVFLNVKPMDEGRDWPN
jgi:hypothetical protein